MKFSCYRVKHMTLNISGQKCWHYQSRIVRDLQTNKRARVNENQLKKRFRKNPRDHRICRLSISQHSIICQLDECKICLWTIVYYNHQSFLTICISLKMWIANRPEVWSASISDESVLNIRTLPSPQHQNMSSL